MKNITYKKLMSALPKQAFIAIAGCLVLSSCGAAYMGGYSETDGVYYDPSRDTLPQGMMTHAGNQIGDYYDYQHTDEQNPYLNAENRNQNWRDAQSSDWGNYTGTDTYYSDSWGSPYGFYSGFGFGMSYGFGFGGYYNPWSIGYSPFYGYYNPYFGSYYGYSPYGYYGYSPYGYYSPYSYGYYAPYGNGYGFNSYNAPGFINKRSGSAGGFRANGTNSNTVRNQNAGFRNDSRTYERGINSQRPYQNTTPQPRYRTTPQNTTPRQNSMPRQSTPNYEQPRYRGNSNSDSGFRSGSSGGFNSGSSSSGGNTRSSGGFRR